MAFQTFNQEMVAINDPNVQKQENVRQLPARGAYMVRYWHPWRPFSQIGWIEENGQNWIDMVQRIIDTEARTKASENKWTIQWKSTAQIMQHYSPGKDKWESLEIDRIQESFIKADDGWMPNNPLTRGCTYTLLKT